MKRTARNHRTDLWGHATDLPQIHVGNYMCLQSNQINTAPDYGAPAYKPKSGPVVENDKKLQLAREKEYMKENLLNCLRWDRNITDPRTTYQWESKTRA